MGAGQGGEKGEGIEERKKFLEGVCKGDVEGEKKGKTKEDRKRKEGREEKEGIAGGENHV